MVNFPISFTFQFSSPLSPNTTFPSFILGFLLTEKLKPQNRHCKLPPPHLITFRHLHPHTLSSFCSRSEQTTIQSRTAPSICVPASGSFHKLRGTLQQSPAFDIITLINFVLGLIPRLQLPPHFFASLVGNFSKAVSKLENSRTITWEKV